MEGIAATAKRLKNLVADVPGANPDMLGVANAEINVTGIGTICNQNAEMVIWNKVAYWIAGDKPDKLQPHLTKR